MEKYQRLLVDVTELKENGYTTGIQRTVSRVLEELSDLVPDHLELAPVFVDEKGVFRASMAHKKIESDEPIEQDTVSENTTYAMLASLWRRLEKTPLLRRLMGTKLAFSSADFVVRLIRTRINRRTVEDSQIIEVDQKSYLLCLDSFWGRDKGRLQALRNCMSSAGGSGLLIHDAIPMSHPNHVPAKSSFDFERAVTTLLPEVENLFFVSEFAKDTFLDFFDEQQWQTMKVIRHGSDSFIHKPQNDRPNKNSRPRFLVVGTLDARKNHKVILEWLESTTMDIEIDMVGRKGNIQGDIYEGLIKRSLEDPRVRVHEQVNDATLRNMYQNCDLGIFASMLEGYGLPLVEFRSFGKKVVCSDIPPFREIADESCFFFNPASHIDLERAITEALGKKEIVEWRGKSWKTAALEYLEFVS